MYSVIVPEVVLVPGRAGGGIEVAAKSERNSSDFKPDRSSNETRSLVYPSVFELLTEEGGDVWVSESVTRLLVHKLFFPST